jgi:hypothetical protein
MGFALWFSLLRECKIADRNYRGWKRKFVVSEQFSHGNEGIRRPFVKKKYISQLTEEEIVSKKEEEEHHWREIWRRTQEPGEKS